jgi:hypothetical protein
VDLCVHVHVCADGGGGGEEGDIAISIYAGHVLPWASSLGRYLGCPGGGQERTAFTWASCAQEEPACPPPPPKDPLLLSFVLWPWPAAISGSSQSPVDLWKADIPF